MVCVLDRFFAPTRVPVVVAVVAHEAADIVRAVLRGWPRFAKLTDCTCTVSVWDGMWRG